MHLAQATTKEFALCSIVGEPKRPLVGERGLGVAAPPAEQVGADRVIEVVALEVQRIDQAEGGVRALYLGQGHAALGAVDEVITAQVLSRLYGIPIDVLRVKDRIVVVSGQGVVEAEAHRHDA